MYPCKLKWFQDETIYTAFLKYIKGAQFLLLHDMNYLDKPSTSSTDLLKKNILNKEWELNGSMGSFREACMEY